ncbi:hypothetical protein T484DRAFT_1750787 [Baffinella frigidus]|nr:hypothetical protein T484DRAFT_1750787 [Cryptophyta sp. CCMP2293]
MPWRHLIFPTAADQELSFSPAPTLRFTAKKEQEQERKLLEAIQDLRLLDAASSATTTRAKTAQWVLAKTIATDLCIRHDTADAISSMPRSEEHAELPAKTPACAALRTTERLLPMSVARIPIPRDELASPA